MNRGGTNRDRLDLSLMDASEGVLERSQMVSVHLVKIDKALNASGQITPWDASAAITAHPSGSGSSSAR